MIREVSSEIDVHQALERITFEDGLGRRHVVTFYIHGAPCPTCGRAQPGPTATREEIVAQIIKELEEVEGKIREHVRLRDASAGRKNDNSTGPVA